MTGLRYRQVARGKRLPAFMRSARTGIEIVDLASLSTEDLWAIHDAAMNHPSTGSGWQGSGSGWRGSGSGWQGSGSKCQVNGLAYKRSSLACRHSGLARQSNGSRGRNRVSLLDLKIELASRLVQNCSLCERKCGVDRTKGEMGFCQLGTDCRYSFEQILWGEEAPLVPSHEIFFTGCNLRCRFCYSWESVIDTSWGEKASPRELASLIDQRRTEGAVNANLIGGEPTVNLLPILKALKCVSKPVAVVWNTNSYMSEETVALLDGVVDLYVADFRFGNNDCAPNIADTDRYFDAASRNLLLIADSGELIIRHLVLPGHIECCLKPIAKWVAANLPNVPFNPMFQYTPFFGAVEDAQLGRCLTKDEINEALEIVSSYGLNTKRWNRPLKGVAQRDGIGSGEISTTVMVQPDGQIKIMHLHSELMDIVQAIQNGG